MPTFHAPTPLTRALLTRALLTRGLLTRGRPTRRLLTRALLTRGLGDVGIARVSVRRERRPWIGLWRRPHGREGRQGNISLVIAAPKWMLRQESLVGNALVGAVGRSTVMTIG